MTENIEPTAGPTNRQAPKLGRAALSQLTLIVRSAEKPWQTRAFTAAELDDAKDYARSIGATVDTLPV